MRTFSITRRSEIDKTFRVQKIATDFDLNIEEVVETFQGQIDLSKPWKIGLIVGSSGTGKTTIAKELFGEQIITSFDYTHKSVVDDMPKECKFEDVSRMFYAVGFGSVVSWLKPYGALSNGEKMRVDLARALLEKEIVCFDEFTSVVDRTVATTMCKAIRKTIDRIGSKQFIAVACHRDIIEHLQPDWIFDTDSMTFSFMNAHPFKCGSTFENVAETSGQNLSVITI